MTSPALAETVKGKGRHYRDPRSDELVPSVTNVVGLLDKPALPRWAARETAKAAWNLRASLDALGEEEAVAVLKSSPWRTSQRAADRGTSIHAWLDAAVSGLPLPALEGQALEYVDAAAAWVERWQPVALHTETTLFGDGYAGTVDAILEIDGDVWLVDYKTSSGLYPEVALQLSALAACPVGVVDGELTEMPVVDRVGAVRIGKDGDWEMREVTHPGAAFAAFHHLLSAWHWKHDGNPLGGKLK